MVPWMPFGAKCATGTSRPATTCPAEEVLTRRSKDERPARLRSCLGRAEESAAQGPPRRRRRAASASARDASTVTCPGGPPAPSELLLTLIIGNLAATPASRREPKESGRPRQHAGQGRDPSRTSWRPRQRLPRTCQSVRRGRHRERAGTDRDSVRRTSRGSDRRRRSRSPATSLRILLPQCSFDSSSAVSVGARPARQRLRELTSERTAGPRTRPGFP